MPKTKVPARDVQMVKDTDNGEEVSFRGGGIKLTPIEPMRKWRLEFEGDLRSLVSSNIIRNKKYIRILILLNINIFVNQGWQS